MKPKIHDFQDYRVYLKTFLAWRREQNKEVSLRAWARNIGVPPSTFSEVLNCRRHVPMDIASKVARTLGLSDNERMQFLLLVIANQALDVELLQYLKKLVAIFDREQGVGSENSPQEDAPQNLEPV